MRRGFTLIELMVVIALPAFPTTLGQWGMTAIHLTGALDDLLRVAADRAFYN